MERYDGKSLVKLSPPVREQKVQGAGLGWRAEEWSLGKGWAGCGTRKELYWGHPVLQIVQSGEGLKHSGLVGTGEVAGGCGHPGLPVS